MPPTATYEQIKAYQNQVEKNKITPHGLGPCPCCHLESIFFKLHAYRERRFLVIVDLLVKAVFCTLGAFQVHRLRQDHHQLSGFCNTAQTLHPPDD